MPARYESTVPTSSCRSMAQLPVRLHVLHERDRSEMRHTRVATDGGFPHFRLFPSKNHICMHLRHPARLIGHLHQARSWVLLRLGWSNSWQIVLSRTSLEACASAAFDTGYRILRVSWHGKRVRRTYNKQSTNDVPPFDSHNRNDCYKTKELMRQRPCISLRKMFFWWRRVR